MNLTQKIINQADRVVRIESTTDISFAGLLQKIATAMVNAHGHYSFVNGKEKTLIILGQSA